MGMQVETLIGIAFMVLIVSHLGFLVIGYKMGRSSRKVRFVQGYPVFPEGDELIDQGPASLDEEDPFEYAMNGRIIREQTMPGE